MKTKKQRGYIDITVKGKFAKHLARKAKSEGLYPVQIVERLLAEDEEKQTKTKETKI
jgi:hypothetical protein